jgi:cyanophycin synthetase
MAGNKPLCYRLLKEKGLPVPEYRVFTARGLTAAEEFMTKHNGSLFVVKPARGTSGSRGITTHIRSFRECCRAGALASLYGDELIIEQLSVGESYRLLILDGRMIHATRRRGVRLTGDGTATIRRLIEKEKERRCVPAALDMASDRDLQSTLRSQGLAMESLPEAGKEVLVKCCDFLPEAKSEVRTVFNEDVTGLICRDLRDAAVHAARALNSRFAGIDIITLDPSVSLHESGGVINEINTTPGLHHHYNLINDQLPPPAVHVLEYLLHYVEPVHRDAGKKHGTFYQKGERL